MRALRTVFAAGVAATVLSLLAGGAHANLVTNGGFETNGGVGEFSSTDPTSTTVAGWTSTGYTFLFSPSTVSTTTGVPGQFGNLALWGPGNGSANGLGASPDGGYFIGSDGASQQTPGPISQTLTGLTAGNQYTVSFYWAAGQQYTFTGPTTEQWDVSFGSQTQDTVVVNNASHGFVPWTKVTFTFTADAASDVLSFLAVGTPQGVPPFSLLDGVDVEAVPTPEPTSLSVFGVGLLAVFGLIRHHRNRRIGSI